MVSDSPTPDSSITEAEFNTNFQAGVTASGKGIIRRTCTLGTYCKIAEMFYKRINPSATFLPYSVLLVSWIEGTDNRHGTDFDLYPTLADTLADTNKYAHCGGFGSAMMAFGDCGATAAVTNNAIGAIGTTGLY